jgi:thiol:disulfide interchange protein DsbD
LNRHRQDSPLRRFAWVASLTALFALALVLFAPGIAHADGGSDTAMFARYASRGPFLAMGISFAIGVVSALTPCVFPMIPITVSIFGATESSSRARGAALSGTFVLGIAALFTPLGVVSALSGKLLGSALSNHYVVIGLAILFGTLASSMFGAFEMTLPANLNNKLSTVGGVGYKGAFVLGLVMGLIAAPCTGPFMTGLVAYIATTHDVALGSLSMFSFALGLGVLFFVAGTFAVSLPKGGAWMLGIKWASGVVLAYMALAYLRDGFPAIHNAVATSNVTVGAIAGVLLVIGLGLGIVHVLAERRRSPIAHLSKPMKLASILPAVVGAFLFLTWRDAHEADTSVAMAVAGADSHPIAWKNKEDTVIAEASQAKKPVIIDFGATWCAACKELDARTWPDPRVQEAAGRFVGLKIDATDDDDPEVKRLETKYKVLGLPTVVVLGSDGSEKLRYNEFVPPEQLAAAVKDVM